MQYIIYRMNIVQRIFKQIKDNLYLCNENKQLVTRDSNAEWERSSAI